MKDYVRSTQTGDLGWLVQRDGQTFVQLDRAHEELIPYREGSWKPDRSVHPFTLWQVAQIAHAADRQLCLYIGLPADSKKSWYDLKEAERSKWMSAGPEGPELRKELYKSIRSLFDPLTG